VLIVHFIEDLYFHTPPQRKTFCISFRTIFCLALFHFYDRRSQWPRGLRLWSVALVCGRSFAGIVGSNSPGGHGWLSVVSVVRCQVEVSASGWSFVQTSPTDCVASLRGSRNLMSEEVIARDGPQHKKKSIMADGTSFIIHTYPRAG